METAEQFLRLAQCWMAKIGPDLLFATLFMPGLMLIIHADGFEWLEVTDRPHYIL
jgi:hypothetical protein